MFLCITLYMNAFNLEIHVEWIPLPETSEQKLYYKYSSIKRLYNIVPKTLITASI